MRGTEKWAVGTKERQGERVRKTGRSEQSKKQWDESKRKAIQGL